MTGLQRLLDHLRLASNGGLAAPGGAVAQQTGTGSVVPSLTASAPAQASQAGDPLTNLVNGFQAWSRAHGGQLDPLAQLAQAHRTAGGDLAGFGGPAVRQVTDPSQQGLAQIGRVNQSGNARNGQAFQDYELGRGLVEHVYYDPKTGRRTVAKFRRPPAA